MTCLGGCAGGDLDCLHPHGIAFLRLVVEFPFLAELHLETLSCEACGDPHLLLTEGLFLDGTVISNTLLFMTRVFLSLPLLTCI